MSSASLPCPRPFESKSAIGIVASRFNEAHTDALVARCLEELKVLAPQADVTVIRVPGAFEIPVAIRAMAASVTPPDAIISFGVIIRGGTEHGDLIATSVTQALQDLAVAHGVPVINQVLLVNNDEQADERCFGEELNRGVEGARAAAAMLDVRQQLLSHYPQKHV